MQPVVADTGPLVSYFDRQDHDHARVEAWFAAQAGKVRLLTTEAVVTEVTHMLDFAVALQSSFIEWAARAVAVISVPQPAYAEIAAWMRSCEKLPMDFADATVLWLYRQNRGASILTLDQRGFGVFRLPGQGRTRPVVVELPR